VNIKVAGESIPVVIAGMARLKNEGSLRYERQGRLMVQRSAIKV
jgi:hypothetical protein